MKDTVKCLTDRPISAAIHLYECPFYFVSRSSTDIMECLSKERGQAGFSDKAWGTPRENDHNGRHELHDVNAPPTARRAGLNLILIKSNKSADEWFLPGPGQSVLFPSLFPPRSRAPWARFCRIKSDSIFFWLRHERNAIKARSERALGETRLYVRVRARGVLTYDSLEKRLAASWNAGFNIVQLRRCCIFTGSY